MIGRCAICLLIYAAILPAAELYTWWIESCTPELARSTGCQAGDPELGRWALEAWQREMGGAIVLKKAATRNMRAFASIGRTGLCIYGETEPVMVDGKRGA